jgi:hypothetical protein
LLLLIDYLRTAIAAAPTAKTGSPSLPGGKANDGQRVAPLRLAAMRLLEDRLLLWDALQAAFGLACPALRER